MYSKAKATIYRHASKPIKIKDTGAHISTSKKSVRPSKLTSRERRSILCEIPKLRESIGSFTTKRLHASAGVQKNISDQTVRPFLHSSGYHFFFTPERKDFSHKMTCG